jgi:hypothetical protein
LRPLREVIASSEAPGPAATAPRGPPRSTTRGWTETRCRSSPRPRVSPLDRIDNGLPHLGRKQHLILCLARGRSQFASDGLRQFTESINQIERNALNPGFTRWIEEIPPKGLEILGKTRIPTFTHHPARFLQIELGKPLKWIENPPQAPEMARSSGESGLR